MVAAAIYGDDWRNVLKDDMAKQELWRRDDDEMNNKKRSLNIQNVDWNKFRIHPRILNRMLKCLGIRKRALI